MPLSRKKERETVFLLLFCSQFNTDINLQTLLETYAEESEEEGITESKYIKDVFFGAIEYKDEAMKLIEGAAIGWSTQRFSKVTLAILQLALFEMNRYDEVPVKIAINEAIELAKKYDDDKAPAFINGLLGTIAKTIQNG